MNLFEGLKEGDLEELVLPIISIDEFESKLDDDSIVLAFSCYDRDPASDLNRFIQKGPVDILDTDVSPAPNEDGLYMVFVELLRDKNTPKNIINILESLAGLTSINDWKCEIYDVEGQHPIDEEFLSKNLRLASQEDHDQHQDKKAEEIKEFFYDSDLDNVIVEDNIVIIEARGSTISLGFVDLGNIDDIYENNAVMQQATRMDESARSNVRRLEKMLGDFWLVEQRGNCLIIGNALNHQNLLLRV